MAPAVFMPHELRKKQLNRGWGEALSRMGEGDKFQWYIPFELGFGDQDQSAPGQGMIPAHSVLIYEVHVIRIEGETVWRPACEPKAAFESTCVTEKEKAYIPEAKRLGLDKWKEERNKIQQIRQAVNNGEVVAASGDAAPAGSGSRI